MSSKLIKDIISSGLQVAINQVLALGVFILTSLYLPKEVYGEFNWSLAILLFTTTVLSLRLEQIVVRKAAAEQDASGIMTLFMIHVVLAGTVFYLLLFLLSLIFPSFFSAHSLLLILGISQLLGFFSSPFKQVANGKEEFGYLAIMSSTANLLRSIGLIISLVFFRLDIQAVLVIFITSSLVELIVCFFLVTVRMQVKLSGRVRFADYLLLLKESLPQIGAAVLIAGISRMDWILLGFFSTASLTAEYSFAYRVYELSPFPLLIIAPVLLSRFSRYFANNTETSLLAEKEKLRLLVRMEMIMATLVPLVLNIIWSPVLDGLTGNKYGAVNQFTFLVLSCCLPFQYITNLFWSAHFAQNRLKPILRITFVIFCVILAGDLLLIPVYNARGAALVYLIAIITEYILYRRVSMLAKIRETWSSLITCSLAAAGSGFAAFYLFDNMYIQLLVALPLFILVTGATRQWRTGDISYVMQLVRRKNKT